MSYIFERIYFVLFWGQELSGFSAAICSHFQEISC